MAYSFVYDFQNIIQVKHRKHRFTKAVLKILCFSAVLIALQGAGCMLGMVLDQRQEMQYAANEMICHIKDGAPLNDALQVFCQELFE